MIKGLDDSNHPTFSLLKFASKLATFFFPMSNLLVVCMIYTCILGSCILEFLDLFSFCSFSYSLSKEIGNCIRKDPNKMQHRDTVMFIVC